MTSAIEFYLVDVFAEQPLTGNPLAVVPDADGLTLPQLRSIAPGVQPVRDHLPDPADGSGRDLAVALVDRGRLRGAGCRPQRAGGLAVAGRLRPAGNRSDRPLADSRSAPTCCRSSSAGLPDGRWRVVMDQSAPVFGPIINDRKDELAAALGLARTTSIRRCPSRWCPPAPDTCWCRFGTRSRWTGLGPWPTGSGRPARQRRRRGLLSVHDGVGRRRRRLRPVLQSDHGHHRRSGHRHRGRPAGRARWSGPAGLPTAPW